MSDYSFPIPIRELRHALSQLSFDSVECKQKHIAAILPRCSCSGQRGGLAARSEGTGGRPEHQRYRLEAQQSSRRPLPELHSSLHTPGKRGMTLGDLALTEEFEFFRKIVQLQVRVQ